MYREVDEERLHMRHMEELDQQIKERKKKYLESAGVNCPFCGSDNISANSPDVDHGTISQDVGCEACGKEWRDWYKLTDMEEL